MSDSPSSNSYNSFSDTSESDSESDYSKGSYELDQVNQPHFSMNRDRRVSDPTLRAFRSSKRGGMRGMGFFSPRVMGASGNLSHCATPIPTPSHRGMPLFGKDAVAASTPMKKSLGGPSTTRVYTKSDRAAFLAAESERNAKENVSMQHVVAPSSLPSNTVSPSVPHILALLPLLKC